MSSLICQKCGKGIYLWDEPEKDDFENRRMKCEKCNHINSIKNFYEHAINKEKILDESRTKIN